MKKCILSILIVMLLFPLYAADPSAEAKVNLDLNADGFIIGFAKDKANAMDFKGDEKPKYSLTPIVNTADLTTTASGTFYLFYKAVIGSGTPYKLYLQIENPLLHTAKAGVSYVETEWIPYTVGIKLTEDGEWGGKSKTSLATGISISSPTTATESAVKGKVEGTDLRNDDDSEILQVSGFAEVTVSVGSDMSGKRKGSYQSTIKLIVSAT